MRSNVESFGYIKAFLDFNEDDVRRLSALAPFVAAYGPSITDRFYDALGAEPETAALLESRVARLKITHNRWMLGLVGGEYGSAYFESRRRIGLIHVRIGLHPVWVEATMSLIRTGLLEKLAEEIDDPVELARYAASLIKICDIDLLIINLAYNEERIERLTSFTGMNRGLIENVIRLADATA